MSDFRVEFKVRNARILRAIEAAGYKNPAVFCRAHNLQYQTLMQVLGLRLTPIGADGNWRPIVQAACDALNMLPEDLFSAAQRTMMLPTNKGIKEVSEAEVLQIVGRDQRIEWETLGSGDPLAALERGDAEVDFAELLDRLQQYSDASLTGRALPARDRELLKLRLMDGLTLDQCAEHFAVTRERIRQLESRALRKLRGTVNHVKATGVLPRKLPLLPVPVAETDDDPIYQLSGDE